MSYVSHNQAGRAQGSILDARYLDAGSHRIVPRKQSDLRPTRERTLTFAKPPAWTESAKCIDEAMFGKSKDYRYDLDYMKPEFAQALCAGCPIIEACLAAAMESEGEVVARHRYGIWGGTTPKMRAELALAERTCSKGHKGRMRQYDSGLACLDCKQISERKQDRKGRREKKAA